jgi:RNA polymerase sigma-70 factor (ECF subfamily)
MGSRGASLEELEALYRRELPRFVRAASAIVGSEARGADVVQDAFASAVRARRSFRREVALEAWVWRIVVNAALQERRRTPAEVELADAVAVDENGFGAGDPGVRRWVAALPERQRVMVFLRYFAGLDYRSVAEALEVEVGTVSATLAAAHAALRRSLQEVER